jgi:import inner membrane translocase subunit TIM16
MSIITHETFQQFEKYFAANSVDKGGSFYLQSKVYRAKQMLDQYIAEKKLEDKEAREKQASQK